MTLASRAGFLLKPFPALENQIGIMTWFNTKVSVIDQFWGGRRANNNRSIVFTDSNDSASSSGCGCITEGPLDVLNRWKTDGKTGKTWELLPHELSWVNAEMRPFLCMQLV